MKSSKHWNSTKTFVMKETWNSLRESLEDQMGAEIVAVFLTPFPLQSHLDKTAHMRLHSSARWWMGLSFTWLSSEVFVMAMQAINAVNGQGTPSQAVLQGLSSLNHSMIQQSLPASSQETSAISTPMHQGPSPGKCQMAMELPNDAALKMAIDASICTASEEGVQLSSGELRNGQNRHWGSSDSKARMLSDAGKFGGWGSDEKQQSAYNGQSSLSAGELRDGQDRRRRSSGSKTKMSSDAGKFGGWGGDQKQQSAYNGWSPSKEEAGPSRVQNSLGEQPRRPVPESEVRTLHSPLAHTQAPVSDLPLPALATPPSAPPLPADYGALENSDLGSICYPPIDTTSARGDLSAGHISNEAAAAASSKGGASQCVVCWDAPAEGVCIPCGHMAGCMNCLSEIKAKNWGCPVCRATIQQVIRVYAVWLSIQSQFMYILGYELLHQGWKYTSAFIEQISSDWKE
jgi:hypothetical protein